MSISRSTLGFLLLVSITPVSGNALAETPAILAFVGDWKEKCSLFQKGEGPLSFDIAKGREFVTKGSAKCWLDYNGKSDRLSFAVPDVKKCNGLGNVGDLVGTYTLLDDGHVAKTNADEVRLYVDCRRYPTRASR
jgi:hypothetical protein